MVNKKTFPILVLVLATLAAFIFSIGFFWITFGAPYFSFKATYGVPPPNQAAPGLPLLLDGIVSGLALTVLIWLGAGIDRLLARIQKTSTRRFMSLLVYLILPGTLCICLPASLIFLIDAMTSSNFNGRESHFAAGLLMVFALLPSVFGFFSVYVGAGVSAFSRWLAARIWPEP